MAERLTLSENVQERPASDWATIAVELHNAQSVIVEGERWSHHVIHQGDGPPLFMYHGVGGHAETFARTLPQLAAAGFHVYAVDALDHGHSEKVSLKSPCSPQERFARMTDGVIDVIDAFGYDTVYFEGESMGAAIGMYLGLKYPDRFEKMILNGFGPLRTNRAAADFPPSPGPSMADLGPLSVAAITDPSYENMANRLHWLVKGPERITDEMVRLRQRLYQDPEINASMREIFGIGKPPPDMQAFMAAAPSEDEVRAAWKTDTLIVWGDHNPGQGVEYGEYIADVIGAKFYEFVDAGHWPQWEKPDEYTRVVLDFLAA